MSVNGIMLVDDTSTLYTMVFAMDQMAVAQDIDDKEYTLGKLIEKHHE